MLTEAELDGMRSCLDLLYPDTGNILSVGYTSDGAGHLTENWGTITPGVPCRVDYRTGKEQITGGALVPYQSAIISMAYDVVITTSNRFEVGSDVFTVQAVNRGASWKSVTRVTAELIA
jgi:head-tail adaptor